MSGGGDGSLASRRRRARVVLAIGVCFGLGYLGYEVATSATAAGLNFAVYRAAAVEFWSGGPVYGVSPVGEPWLTFRYPPITLAWFSLYLPAGPLAGYLLHVATTIAAGTALGLVVAREIERYGLALSAVDRGLVVSFVCVGPFAAPSLLYGNVNHHLALAVGVGLVWLAHDRQTGAGVALGLAALLKVFPAGIGVWLLRRRAWRAVAAALATGLLGLVAGIAVAGLDRTRSFVEIELLSRATPAELVGGVPPESEYVTLVRPLSRLLPATSHRTLTLVAVAAAVPVLFVCYRDVSTPTDRLLGVFVTLAALLLVLPSFSLYFLVLGYPLVVLLYVLPARSGTLFAVGAGVSLLTLKLPDVALVVEVLPVPGYLATLVMAGARALYAVGTPVLWGTLLMVAACLREVVREAGPASRASS